LDEISQNVRGFRGRFPVVRIDNGETHVPFFVHIRMVDLCLEEDGRGLEGVLFRKGHLDSECSVVVRHFRRYDKTLPDQDIGFINLEARDSGNFERLNFSNFL
jgi:hypothetical protein